MRTDLIYIQELLNETRVLRKERGNYRFINKKLSKELMEFEKSLDSINDSIKTLRSELTELREKKDLKTKKLQEKEKLLANRLKRNDFFDENVSAGNKIENIIKSELSSISDRNHILESIIYELGNEFAFKENILNLIIEFIDKNEDTILKQLVENKK